MKRLIYFFTILFCVVGFDAAIYAEEDFPYIGVVSTEKLRVLPRRGTNFREIAVLNRNDLVTVIGKSGEWLQIQPPESLAVWISGEFIDSNGVVTGSRVNIRKGPAVANPVLGQVNRGESLTVIDSQDGWKKILPPASISAWVPAEFVEYFSNKGEASVQVERMEQSKESFDNATSYKDSQLAKQNYEEIDFKGIRKRYYDVIAQYPDTLYANQALFELTTLEAEQRRRELDHFETQRQLEVRQLYNDAENFTRTELNKNIETVDMSSITDQYMKIIEIYPGSEEAKWSVDRLKKVYEHVSQNAEKRKAERMELLIAAEDYRNAQLLKEVSDINYDGIILKYEKVVDLDPDSLEASKARERITDIRTRKAEANGTVQQPTVSTGQSTTEPPAHQQVTSIKKQYTYTGYLLKESDSPGSATLYKVEERGFFHREDLCLFRSYDPNIQKYIGKKVIVTGTLQSLDMDNRPVLDLIRIEEE